MRRSLAASLLAHAAAVLFFVIPWPKPDQEPLATASTLTKARIHFVGGDPLRESGGGSGNRGETPTALLRGKPVEYSGLLIVKFDLVSGK